MKFAKFISAFLILSLLNSCAYFFNSKTVDVAILSDPEGADIIIEGRNYGQTPEVINIEPKNYTVTLVKAGQGSAQINLEAWQAVRAKQGEGARCIADTLGSILILPLFSLMSVYCRDFKHQEYFAKIPYQGPTGGNRYSGPATNLVAPQPMNSAYPYNAQQMNMQMQMNGYRGY